ncbi:UNVERIFIED_CONTAM: hypothetical protein GTU68_059639, partial [Idotea baltica]|nr:hypothetical protein [Idotea baltica]
KSGVDEYLKRLRRYATVEVQQLRENGPEENGKRALAASEACIRIILDERGAGLSTAKFVKQVQAWQMDGVKRVALIIGGADGHTKETRAAADVLLKLSDFTLQHEMALVILLEQIYRVHTVMKGEPYHR